MSFRLFMVSAMGLRVCRYYLAILWYLWEVCLGMHTSRWVDFDNFDYFGSKSSSSDDLPPIAIT